MMIVASSRLVAAARYGGNTRDARRRGGAADPNAESEWMDKARKLANQRAARFRQERGAQPVAPAGWRRRRKPKKDGDFDEYAGAARGYDDVPGPGRRVDADEMEMTATAGDGLWRVDMAGLSEEDWATQWTMTAEEFAAVKRDAKANARDPIAALRAFEDAGLRRISPNIAAEMLRVVADKAKSARVDREELAGLRRDARFAHLLGTCVAAARRGSDALSAGGVAGAAWSLAVIAGERANSAEMEVLSDRAAALVDDMSPRQCADLSWALASCRHAAPAAFGALGVRAAVGGLAGFKAFDVSTITWAFAHLGHDAVGLLEGLEQWFAGGAAEDLEPAVAAAAAAERAAKFTPQALVTTAWSLAVVGGEALRGGAFAALWGEISARGDAAAADAPPIDAAASGASVEFGLWRGKHLNQIHQCAVAVDAAGGAEAIGLAPLPDALAAAAGDAWLAQRRPPVVSWYQRDVASILAYMGEKHEEEAVCAGYRVDLLIPSPVGIDDDAHRAAASGGVAVEVDGPSHFARNDASVALGQTRLKHRQLRGLGFAVLSVAVADWEFMESSEEKVEYLREGMAHAAALAAEAKRA